MTLAVVMVAKDMQPMTQTCISALENSLELAGLAGTSALVLVDNSSVDPLKKSWLSVGIPTVIVRLDKNHSFSAASNFGAKKAPKADLLLFLNNDVFLHPEALREMLEAASRFSAAICGVRLVYPNGLIQHAGVGFRPGMAGPYHLDHMTPSRLVPRITSYYQAVTGAVMLVDSDLFWSLGGFDEMYPFGYEDIDFCLRAAETGSKIICSHQVESVHLSGQSRNAETNAYATLSEELFQSRWGGRVPPNTLESDRKN